MTAEPTYPNDNSPVIALSRAVLGAVPLLLVALVPPIDRWPPVWLPAALLGLWLCAASMVSYFSMRVSRPGMARWTRPLIPLRFSGPTGRFALRQRGDGRKVEVIAGPQVVAELTASDDGDALVVHADMVPDAELGDLGSAIGQAIEMVAAADEDSADRQEPEVAGPRGSMTMLPPGW